MSHVLPVLEYSTAFGPLWAVLLTLVGLPLANEVVQRSPVKAQSILQLIAGIILSIPAVGPIITKFPVVGDLLYIFSPKEGREKLAKPLLYRPKATAGEIITNQNASLRALVPFLIAGFLLHGCAHISPNVQQYDAALAACLESNGIAAAGGEASQILQILETGGGTSQQIVTSIESAVIAAGGTAAILVANCAVQAWFDQHPVVTGKGISASQAAARVFLANHAPGAHQSAAHRVRL